MTFDPERSIKEQLLEAGIEADLPEKVVAPTTPVIFTEQELLVQFVENLREGIQGRDQAPRHIIDEINDAGSLDTRAE